MQIKKSEIYNLSYYLKETGLFNIMVYLELGIDLSSLRVLLITSFINLDFVLIKIHHLQIALNYCSSAASGAGSTKDEGLRDSQGHVLRNARAITNSRWSGGDRRPWGNTGIDVSDIA